VKISLPPMGCTVLLACPWFLIAPYPGKPLKYQHWSVNATGIGPSVSSTLWTGDWTLGVSVDWPYDKMVPEESGIGPGFIKQKLYRTIWVCLNEVVCT